MTLCVCLCVSECVCAYMCMCMYVWCVGMLVCVCVTYCICDGGHRSMLWCFVGVVKPHPLHLAAIMSVESLYGSQ